MFLLRLIFVILLRFIWSTIPVAQPSPELFLSGIRRSDLNGPKVAVEVLPDEKFSIRLLGKNLPDYGFYFTTATRCEDAYLLNISTISTIRAKVDESYCSYAILSLKNGLPFNTSMNIYHLCHKNGTTVSEKYLGIRKKDVSESEEPWTDKILLCCICILMSAYSSGMTLGYMRFSILELNTMINGGDDAMAKRAHRILQFRRHSNYLVVAFSLFSSIFSVLFTTTVEKLLNGIPNESILEIAVPAMISLVFAEVIPQAVCNSKLGFNLASGLWLVSVLIFIVTFPIAYPASLVLGRFLKRDVREVFTQEEKTCMIRYLAKKANEKEKTILENATTFSMKRVGKLMVPIQEVFMLSKSQKLNRPTILTLVEKGYTRVPIYDDKNRNTIVGMLNMKDLNLVTCDLSKEPTVGDVLSQLESLKEQKQQPKFIAKYVNIEMDAQLLLSQMRTGDFHFACVVDYATYDPKVVGIITIEDILEELFGKIDEKNERRDRADNEVIGWCREAGTDDKYPLSFSQQLRVIQYLFDECQILKSLDITILKAKNLLSVERIRVAKKGELLPLENLLLVIWSGTVTVTNLAETFDQDVRVPHKKSASKESPDENPRNPPVPVLIVGKPLLSKLIKSLRKPIEEPLELDDYVSEVKAVSSEVSYFKLRLEDLLNCTNGCTMVKKNTNSRNDGSLIQRLNSRQSTPVSTTPVGNSPKKSIETKTVENDSGTEN